MAGVEIKEKTMTRDLTQGNVVKQLIIFSAPLFLSNVLQSVYNIVDMIVIGRVVGGSGMSAVSTGGNVLNLLMFLAMGFSSAGQVLIAKSVGVNDRQSIKATIGSMFTILLSMSVVMSVVCFMFRNQILHLVNTPEEAYLYTMDYTIICITGLIFIYGYNIVSAILRGMGDSKRPFYFVAVATVVNIILDIVFVAYLDMAAKGAALATVIGQAVSFFYSLIYLYIKKESFGFDFKLKSFIPDMVISKKIFALGIPMSMQAAAIHLSLTVVAAWVNTFGVISSAIAGIYSKLGAVMGIMSNSTTTAAASMVGQNLGAKKYKRVPQILFWAMGLSAIMALICSLALYIQPEAIFLLFTKDMEVVSKAAIIMIPSILNFFGCAARTFAFGIINGSGNAKLNLAIALFDGLISRIGLAYLLGFVLAWGPFGFWMGDAIAGYVPLLIGGTYYASGRWNRCR
ncbi:MAG: MATE family efflux transporter [Treponema sp.]|uniref:MATE family efflux transporter n=1 Tax=Treponema sp. TaxID=166 RepID=UPI00298E5501|nr:MATE family efflux transporter [Treponema sp.]MCQ2601638.1 MATE family efflux transporter [Treponema sp.]